MLSHVFALAGFRFDHGNAFCAMSYSLGYFVSTSDERTIHMVEILRKQVLHSHVIKYSSFSNLSEVCFLLINKFFKNIYNLLVGSSS